MFIGRVETCQEGLTRMVCRGGKKLVRGRGLQMGVHPQTRRVVTLRQKELCSQSNAAVALGGGKECFVEANTWGKGPRGLTLCDRDQLYSWCSETEKGPKLDEQRCKKAEQTGTRTNRMAR